MDVVEGRSAKKRLAGRVDDQLRQLVSRSVLTGTGKRRRGLISWKTAFEWGALLDARR
jgi:hypothetical protein